MVQEIYVIENTNKLKEKLTENFKRELDEYKFKTIKTAELEVALRNIPSLIIIDEDTADVNIVEFCKSIRSNEDNRITPIMVVSSNTDINHKIEVLKTDVEYYMERPIDEEYIYYTIKNITGLLTKNRGISPLTGLPGNVQIQAEMKKRLLNKETFAILYFDLDNFKAYNDVYGFLKGDEIIQFTSDVILSAAHTAFSEGVFVGHIGGDDFIAITPNMDIEDLCQTMIATFDKGVRKFFIEADQEKGFIEVENRKGVVEQFPLTSVSIGVVVAEKGRFVNILEIGEVSTQVKHLAKSIQGSSYAIDRRKHE